MDRESNEREAADAPRIEHRASPPSGNVADHESLARLSLGELLYRVLVGGNAAGGA